MCDSKLAVAERLLRDFLKENPTDAAAIRMLAETGSRLGRYEDAEKLLARCLELAPSFDMARHNYAIVLYRQNKSVEALAAARSAPAARSARSWRAQPEGGMLVRIGEFQAAIAIYEKLLKDHPNQPKAWMSYGHALKTVGRTEDGIAAYRHSIELLPSLGEAYWSLANLKTFRFSDADIAAMRAQLARADLRAEDRLHLHFALGKALEDRGEYADSFAQYEQGNAHAARARCRTTPKNRRPGRAAPRRFSRRTSSPRAPDGAPGARSHLHRRPAAFRLDPARADPVQPFASRRHDGVARHHRHRQAAGRRQARCGRNPPIPNCSPRCDAAELRALGEDISTRTRIQRKSGRPFFIDKMPNNWLHAGLIHLILPNAKIIDARRHPLACCFSNFKQHFARGQGFTYGLADSAAITPTMWS